MLTLMDIAKEIYLKNQSIYTTEVYMLLFRFNCKTATLLIICHL